LVQGGAFHLRGSWSRSMVVASGSPCGGTFAAGGRVSFKRLYLTGSPQHGRVVLQEGGHYHYTSTAGYHGPDSFSLRVCGIGPRGGEGCGNLHYSVTVE
jgi:Bacterial Ig domain